MLGDKELVKCFKCDYYHPQDDKHIKQGSDNKWLCNTCADFNLRTKDDLRIGASFDKAQQVILKDLAYRIRLLELENKGLQAKIERAENSKISKKLK